MTVQQINQITKGADGDSHLIDYGAGFPSMTAPGGGTSNASTKKSAQDKLGSR